MGDLLNRFREHKGFLDVVRKGAVKAAEIVRDDSEIAVEAIKQHGAHGQRP